MFLQFFMVVSLLFIAMRCGILAMNGGDSKNSVDAAQASELADQLSGLRSDEVSFNWFVLLTSNGIFCGGSLAQLHWQTQDIITVITPWRCSDDLLHHVRVGHPVEVKTVGGAPISFQPHNEYHLRFGVLEGLKLTEIPKQQPIHLATKEMRHIKEGIAVKVHNGIAPAPMALDRPTVSNGIAFQRCIYRGLFSGTPVARRVHVVENADCKIPPEKNDQYFCVKDDEGGLVDNVGDGFPFFIEEKGVQYLAGIFVSKHEPTVFPGLTVYVAAESI